MADPEWGVNFETNEITRPDPESTTPQGDTDDTFDAFADDPNEAQAQPIKPASVPEAVPKYRFDEVNNRLRESAEREQRLMAMLQQQRQPPQTGMPGAPGPTPEVDPTRERIRAQILEVFPEFKEFLEFRKNIPSLTSAAEAIPRMQAETDRYWGAYADQQLQAVHAELSQRLGAPLPAHSRLGQIANQSFATFVSTNPTIQARYERNDPSVVKEFMAMFEAEVLAPARRPQQVASRVENTRRLPVAGRTSPPPLAPVPKPNMDNEDEVFQAAWSVIQNARQGSTQ